MTGKVPSEITIRRAVSEDAAAIAAIHFETWLATYPKVVDNVTEEMVRQRFAGRGTTEQRIEEFRARISRQKDNKIALVAEENGKLIGFAQATKDEEGRLLRSLYVSPTSQGKGAGRKLLNSVLNWMEAEKYPAILHVVKTNHPAISFYEHSGFKFSRDMPEETRKPFPNNIIMPSIEMIRPPGALID